LEEKRVKYDDLVKKYVMIKEEQLSLKKALEVENMLTRSL
jgi:hypothetical protein